MIARITLVVMHVHLRRGQHTMSTPSAEVVPDTSPGVLLQVVNDWLDQLNSALTESAASATAELFEEDG